MPEAVGPLLQIRHPHDGDRLPVETEIVEVNLGLQVHSYKDLAIPK